MAPPLGRSRPSHPKGRLQSQPIRSPLEIGSGLSLEKTWVTVRAYRKGKKIGKIVTRGKLESRQRIASLAAQETAYTHLLRSVGAVDLCLLQLVGVIDVDRLPLRVEIDRADAALAMPVAGSLHPAEGQVHLSPDRRRVDIGDARVKVAHRDECLVDIFRVQGRREPVLYAVRDGNGIFEVLARDNRNYRSEDFFLRDAHLRVDIDKHRGLHEESIRILALFQAVAARHHLGAVILADFDVLEIGVELILVDGGAHIDALVEAVANLQRLGARNIALHEFAVHALLHDDAAGGRAPLTRRPEATPDTAFNGKIEIGIVQHDHRILTTQFQRTMLETLGRGGAHDAPNFTGSGQRNRADLRMLRNWRTHAGAEPGDDIDDSFGKPRIHQGANQIEGGKRGVLRRLDHASVAAHDRWQQLPRRDRHREVPGGDHPADAQRLAHRHRKLAGQFGRRGGPKHPPALTRHVVGSIDRFLRIASGLLDDLPHLAGHVARVLLFPLTQDFPSPIDDFSANWSRNEPPLGEGAFGSLHGGIHIRLARLLEDADHFPGVGRVAVFEGFAGRGLDPLAVDEVLVNLCSISAYNGRAGHGIGCHKASSHRTKTSMLQPACGSGKRGWRARCRDTRKTRYRDKMNARTGGEWVSPP